tara:strand:+ start:1117 stop:1692 length:576 start_codon:yes stop_codon:yes gene_type:complete
MSTRPNAPYKDEVLDNGQVLIYEGHDLPNYKDGPDPKSVDQPLKLPSGKLTQNGYFFEAAQVRGATENFERVYVYEKIKAGIWVYNGVFALRSAYIENVDNRNICKFRLELLDEQTSHTANIDLDHTRMIPSSVKQAVWKRDSGKCQDCGATENLHFDHIIPFSKGGSSLTAENIQLLCAKHNLHKSAKIM